MSEIVILDEIPSDSDLMTVDQFSKYVKANALIDYDGDGYWATATKVSRIIIKPSGFKSTKKPDWATHIVWFNR